MNKLTSVERIMKALKVEEPDVVPHWDGVHRKVATAILPDDSQDRSMGLNAAFVEYMDIDAIGNFDKIHSWRLETVDDAKNIQRDQWGGLVQFTTEAIPIPIEPMIKSEKDLED